MSIIYHNDNLHDYIFILSIYVSYIDMVSKCLLKSLICVVINVYN